MALDILRVEKGYLTHSELNGQTTPYDLGMQGLMKREDNYVGRPAAAAAGISRTEPPSPRGPARCRAAGKFLAAPK